MSWKFIPAATCVCNKLKSSIVYISDTKSFTSISQYFVWLFDVTFIFVVPRDFAVTFPFITVAISSFSLSHFAVFVTLLSLYFAFNCTIWVIAIFNFVLFIAKLLFCFTVIFALAVLVLSLFHTAVISAFPTPVPTISPLALISTILLSLLENSI